MKSLLLLFLCVLPLTLPSCQSVREVTSMKPCEQISDAVLLRLDYQVLDAATIRRVVTESYGSVSVTGTNESNLMYWVYSGSIYDADLHAPIMIITRTYLDHQISIDNMITCLGAPEYYSSSFVPTQATIVFFYPSKGIVVISDGVGRRAWGRVSGKEPATSIMYMTPSSGEEMFRRVYQEDSSTRMKPWPGSLSAIPPVDKWKPFTK